MLQLLDVGRHFGQVEALRDVSLTIGAGDFIALLGPSGCGKSTLLRLIAGLDRPDNGELTWEAGHQPRPGEIGFVFQGTRLPGSSNGASPMSLHHPTVAIVGATGAVGAELLACLETRGFPLERLRLFASGRSAGRRLLFRGDGIPVEELNEDSFPGVDIALFSAGGAVSRRFAPIAVRQGAVVVDNSSAFRMEPAVPLVVPEVNPDAIARHIGIVANPNCVAIVAVVPLWPLHRHNRIRRVIAATYQAASGAGAAAMEELRASTAAYLQGSEYRHHVLAHPYAFNLFSHDTRVDPVSGYNEEETKVMRELRKIMASRTCASASPAFACRCCAPIRSR